jgi:hypothetical protein
MVRLLTFGLIILPGLFGGSTWLSNRFGKLKTSFRKALAYYSQVLVPLGLMGWIAFTISFAFVKFAYVLPVISDPLGLGWNLLGTTGNAGVGQSTSFSLLLQVLILSVGMVWSTRVARRISESMKQAIPLIVFSGAFTVSLLWLLIG